MENGLLLSIQSGQHHIELKIIGEDSNLETIFKIDPLEASENGEAGIQLIEGHFYEYSVSGNYSLKASEIVFPSKINPGSGRLAPNVYTGTATFEILTYPQKHKCAELKVEIRSQKASYRQDYRLMLENITEHCTDLLLAHNSPVTHNFTVDFNQDSRTLYQRFAFIKSILQSDEFVGAVHKIISVPVTKWSENEELKDIRRIRRVDGRIIRHMAGSGNRISIPASHSLFEKLGNIPARVTMFSKTESLDTPENRFVKHALTSFAALVSDFKSCAGNGSRLFEEASILENELDLMLTNPFFQQISNPAMLSLNSPVLQRKSGYKEVFRIWLMFDLAAKLVWRGGDDVYAAGKKDVAVLYEYWLFFQLLDLIRDTFDITPASIASLIKPTADGLGLTLKRGRHIAVQGIFNGHSRRLNVEYSFNRSFSGKNDYPNPGSWTTGMRPDFTLSIWPAGINQAQAETEELIVHIHFDAKYRVESFTEYKRDDLLKMHSYKDAIRRTAGAYVLYPGEGEKPFKWKGFNELIPGLGAFAVRPSRTNNGINALRNFLKDVTRHFLNRASQREKAAFRSYDIYKSKNNEAVTEQLPETFGENRSLIPDETFVIIGFYKNAQQLAWIEKSKLYNFRTGTDSGSLPLGAKQAEAKYLLLHGPRETVSGRLCKLKDDGPRIFSKQDLLKKQYPNPKGALYLVYHIDLQVESEFKNQKWDITKLPGYKPNRASGVPFVVSLSELTKALMK
ncbi:DUF2357 domain-containing protein [Dyadobacter sp. CY107]|uniref:DUF2357 domain-containing protein n=1 Tax=Dyadobacter fanqingshengii TaxID=2906443 RepID=UPI001F39FD09|nr:DUF2357 domain-containing protein [Dyadobacter fanqingshengii]MCF2506943.1 DUF2357 domain-containing protein [Dyadobacter fanqingshengii]